MTDTIELEQALGELRYDNSNDAMLKELFRGNLAVGRSQAMRGIVDPSIGMRLCAFRDELVRRGLAVDMGADETWLPI